MSLTERGEEDSLIICLSVSPWIELSTLKSFIIRKLNDFLVSNLLQVPSKAHFQIGRTSILSVEEGDRRGDD
jgi:hypothetical protein